MAIVAIVNGEEMRVDKIVETGNCENGAAEWGNSFFYGYVQNSFDPMRFLVCAESLQEAYDWLICDPRMEEMLKVDIDTDQDRRFFILDYGQDIDFASRETIMKLAGDELDDAFREAAEYASEVGSVEHNDNGTVIDSDGLMMFECGVAIRFDKEDAR